MYVGGGFAVNLPSVFVLDSFDPSLDAKRLTGFLFFLSFS